MRILLTGCRGQVGSELARILPALGEVIATDRSSLDLIAAASIREFLEGTRPDVIVRKWLPASDPALLAKCVRP